jgi:predicted permease
MQTFHHLWHAVRQWLRRPMLLGLAIVPLALAIGVLTALFTVVNVSLLRPLPGIHNSDALVELERAGTGGVGSMSYPDFKDLAAQTQTLKDVYAYSVSPLSVRPDGAANASNSFGMLVTSSYFAALGVRAEAGRMLQDQDMARDGGVPAAVISNAAFQRLFNGSTDAIGRTLMINGSAFALVGVTAAEFNGHIAGISPDFYLPLTRRDLLRPAEGGTLLDNRLASWLLTGARIAEGYTLANVHSELATIAERLSAVRRELRDDARSTLRLSATPLHPLPRAARMGLLVFVGILSLMVVTLMLVACINVAGLALARAEERRGELAIRLSLGATHRQLATMMLADALVLSVTATALGLALAWFGLKALLAVPLPVPIPLHIDISLDTHIIGFALFMALVTTLACGFIPAWRAARSRITGELQRFRGSRARHVLSVLQIAATLVLLVNGGAILRAMQQLEGINPGMRVDGILAMEFNLETSGYDTERSIPVAERLLDTVRELPGIEHAALARVVPLTLSSMSLGTIRGPGLPEEGLTPEANIISEGYVRTLGISLTGRDFNSADRRDTPRVAILNRFLARQIFGDAEPIGRSFAYGDGDELDQVQVIGVVEDGQYTTLGEAPRSYLLLPFTQHPWPNMSLVMHSALSPGQATAAIGTVMAALDPNLPPPQIYRLGELAAIALLPQRVASAVVTGLGALGLLLVALGLYGLLAQFVQSHLREIGVRLALGAEPQRISREVRWRGLRLVLLGLAVACVPALGVLKLVSTVIVGVQAFDLTVLGIACFSMLAIAFAACYGPSRRAAGTAPSAALRQD